VHEEGESHKVQLRNRKSISLFEVLAAFSLRVDECVPVKLREVEIAALPMELALRDAMQLAEDVEVAAAKIDRAFYFLQLA